MATTHRMKLSAADEVTKEGFEQGEQRSQPLALFFHSICRAKGHNNGRPKHALHICPQPRPSFTHPDTQPGAICARYRSLDRCPCLPWRCLPYASRPGLYSRKSVTGSGYWCVWICYV